MRQILFILLATLLSGSIHSQCNELFISEIVEGWSNNKAIEIYNPNNSPQSLNGYGLVKFQNGSTTYGEITPLDGYTIAPFDVFVVVLDKRDSLGTGLEAPIWDDLQSKADIFVSPNYDNGVWVMYFNGNDAIALVKNNGQTLVDLFGRIGEGTGFGGWSPLGTLDSQGNPNYASKDYTLIRKANVTSGITTNPSSFDVFAQYDTLPANTFSNLGCHISQCGNSSPCSIQAQYGCTNPQACNYNPAAEINNGSCIYKGSSCNDNNPTTTIDYIDNECNCAGIIGAGNCSDDFYFSEIIEGWSNNHAIEIYNPTNTTKSLDGYGLVRFANGSTSYGNITPLDGYSVGPHDVFVAVLDKRDSLGSGLEAPVWSELKSKADVFINPTYDNGVWVMYFNGNDAIGLVKNNGQTLVDLFGRIGEGTGFGGWSPLSTLDSQGNPNYASKDHTLIRKANVTSGITTNPSSFDVFAQYDTLPANTFSNLGCHISQCGISPPCLSEEQYGCTNPQACNFNPSATQDNGSCILPHTEICDNVDNNCNGVVDDNCVFVNFNSLTCDSAITLENTQIIYPDTIINLSAGILGQHYEQGIFINTPVDAGTIDPSYAGYAISTLQIQSITYNGGLPLSNLGLISSCSITNCSFPAGEQNCITISGTPNQEGIFDIEIHSVVTALLFGFPIPIDLNFTGYKILILDSITSILTGCTNPQACNYNANAIQDNGSCIIRSIEFCDNIDNNCDGIVDNNCNIICTSNVSLTNGQTIYPDAVTNFGTGLVNEYYEQGIFINPQSDAGLLDPTYAGYTLSSITLESITYNNGFPISNLGLSVSCNQSNCTFPTNQQNCFSIIGIPIQSGSFEIELNFAATALIFGFPVPIDYTYGGYQINIIDSVLNPIFGCTNPQACNFNPSANQDNGSCLVIGSTCNDGNNATINDVVGSSCTCAGTPTDLNGNNENTYQGLFYQAVARNADGTPMANQNISIRFSLHQSSATGAIEYQEVQNVSSNAMGLFTTFFGTGQAVIGNFNNIQWGVNAKYLQVEMNLNGWQTIGTQQLAAVPYAIRAKEVDPSGLKLQSPNGNCYILQVNNNGSLSTLQVPCD
jgi:hypothetical protein